MTELQTRETDINKTGIRYPLDETGTNPENYIKDEIHTVSSTRYADYNLIVPEFPPFFTKDIVVKYKKNANTAFVELKEGADYSLGLYYKGATRVLGMSVYGCLIFNNLDLDGIILVSYRTVGGEHLVDRRHVLETLIENVWNPREVMWEYVTNRPNLYPPEKHPVDWEDIKKLDDLVKVLKELGDTVATTNKEISDQIAEFLQTIDVPKFNSMMMTLESHSYTDLMNRQRALEVRQRELEDRMKEFLEKKK